MRRARRRGIVFAGNKLDAQQTEAVVACEDAQLVLASAGSGKTLSLLAKVDYLINTLKIDPSRILVISFTRKTVAELRERCAFDAVEIRTFHGLGNYLLQFFNQSDLGRRRLISEEEITGFIWRYLDDVALSDECVARRQNDFLLFYLSCPKAPGCFASDSARVSFNRANLRSSLRAELLRKAAKRNNLAKNTNTLLGSPIRAKDEQLIANWLFIYQLKYVHGEKYSDDYRPNFRVGDIYIDLAVVNARGESSYGAQYLRDLKWRRELHEANNTKYIELPTCEWVNGKIFEHLEEYLRLHGAKPIRMAEQRIWRLIKECYTQEYNDFVSKLSTFLLLYKNNLHNLENVRAKARHFPTAWERARVELFLDIFEGLLGAYEAYLASARLYDFADMINQATEAVHDIDNCANYYRYILLDEVQDLSKNRLALVREILRKNPECHLFAVGDDWQSIYRFTGSNLELIEKFGQFFEKETRRSLIETTHRFGAPTTKVSSGFIQKNPAQARKHIRGASRETPINICFVEPEDGANRLDDSPAFNRIMQYLLDRYGYKKLKEKEIQIISRFNHDYRRLDADNIAVSPDAIIWRNPEIVEQEIKMEFCSMHKSKGITRDIVIVLNMTNDLMGMPAQRESDPIIDMLLSDAEPYAYAEERRLFYVAITRAREATFLIGQRKNPSPFLFEISEELRESIQDLCPRCETGQLIRKQTKNGAFYYCSNYAYGCNYLKH